MNQSWSPLDDAAQKAVGQLLHDALVDLVDLSLLGKQAHWTVVGPRFRTLHLQLDEVVDAARRQADAVAERASAIGVAPDARAATVAARSGLSQPPADWLADDTVVAQFVDVYGTVIGRMRERIDQAESADPVTQDLLIQITAELEKQAWMFHAEQSAAAAAAQ